MYCKYCHKQIPDYSKQCPHCKKFLFQDNMNPANNRTSMPGARGNNTWNNHSQQGRPSSASKYLPLIIVDIIVAIIFLMLIVVFFMQKKKATSTVSSVTTTQSAYATSATSFHASNTQPATTATTQAATTATTQAATTATTQAATTATTQAATTATTQAATTATTQATTEESYETNITQGHNSANSASNPVDNGNPSSSSNGINSNNPISEPNSPYAGGQSNSNEVTPIPEEEPLPNPEPIPDPEDKPLPDDPVIPSIPAGQSYIVPDLSVIEDQESLYNGIPVYHLPGDQEACGYLPFNSVCNVYESDYMGDSEWLHVNYCGLDGWASTNYLIYLSDDVCYPYIGENDTSCTIYISSSSTVACNQPSTDSALEDYEFLYGKEISVSSFVDGWAFTNYEGQDLYINMADARTYVDGTYQVKDNEFSSILLYAYTDEAEAVCDIPSRTMLQFESFANGYGYCHYDEFDGWVRLSEVLLCSR